MLFLSQKSRKLPPFKTWSSSRETSCSFAPASLTGISMFRDFSLTCHFQNTLLISNLYSSAPAEDRIAKVRDNHEHIGLQANADTVRWLYSKHFSAVAGDTFAFECWPPPKECCLHEWLLGYWGTPIGEMWNLEKLSQVCAEVGRWEFFLTSASLNIPGGIASPPGAVAIF